MSNTVSNNDRFLKLDTYTSIQTNKKVLSLKDSSISFPERKIKLDNIVLKVEKFSKIVTYPVKDLSNLTSHFERYFHFQSQQENSKRNKSFKTPCITLSYQLAALSSHYVEQKIITELWKGGGGIKSTFLHILNCASPDCFIDPPLGVEWKTVIKYTL